MNYVISLQYELISKKIIEYLNTLVLEKKDFFFIKNILLKMVCIKMGRVGNSYYNNRTIIKIYHVIAEEMDRQPETIQKRVSKILANVSKQQFKELGFRRTPTPKGFLDHLSSKIVEQVKKEIEKGKKEGRIVG